jgi:hemolysin III
MDYSLTTIPFFGAAEPFSAWSHLLAALAALIGMFFLMARGRGSAGRMASLVIYSVAMIFLFSMSGVYHFLNREIFAKIVFQRLDHAAIWTMVAGTFTPLHAILFRGPWRWGVLAFIWTVAITGLVLKTIFFKEIAIWLSLSFYLGLGWIGVLSFWKFSKVYGLKKNRQIVFGGLCYTIGALIEFAQWPTLVPGVIGPHEIFHVFVIMGAAYHWWFIYEWADHPVRDNLFFDVSVCGNSLAAKSRGENIRVGAQSKEELQSKIKEAVSRKYHRCKKRHGICLRYYQDEVF